MSSSVVILFAHGAREPEWAQPFESIRDRLRAAGTPVELAFLEFMSPSLDEAAERLADKGTVIIVPVFLAQGAHLKRALPAMVAKLRRSSRRSRRGCSARRAEERKVKLADKPGSVVDSHSSRPRVAPALEPSTRGLGEPRRRPPI